MNSVQHYENFPVASFLVPREIRPAVIALYRFARGADDIADEGDALPEQRLTSLAAWEAAVAALEHRIPAQIDAVKALEPLVVAERISTIHLRDLLSAFRQDVTVTRYATYDELLDYCSRSANPVGRLMLQLMQVQGANAEDASDAICTALQLINFWQDVAVDWKKSRIYLPREDCARFNVTEDDIAQGHVSDAWRALMTFEVNRTRKLMLSGRPLLPLLRGRMRWEIAFTIAGGLTILDRIEAVNYDVFGQRPVLGWKTLPRLLRHTGELLL